MRKSVMGIGQRMYGVITCPGRAALFSHGSELGWTILNREIEISPGKFSARRL